MSKTPSFSQHMIRTIRKDQGAANILYAGLCHLNDSISAMSNEDIRASLPFFPPALVRERIGFLVEDLLQMKDRTAGNKQLSNK